MFIYDENREVSFQRHSSILLLYSVFYPYCPIQGLLKLTTERVRDDISNCWTRNLITDFKDAFKEAFTNRPLIGMMVATLGSTLLYRVLLH